MPYREPEHHEREPAAPSYVEGPIAWENAALSWPRRLLGTLNASFLPIETVRAVAGGPLAPAVGFALLTALPWAAASGIVPFTHTLHFKGNLVVEALPKPGMSLASDLALSMGIGLALTLISLLAWSVPFASLLKAFARESDQALAPSAAYRMALYRIWLVPCGFSLYYLSMSVLPAPPPAFVNDLTALFFLMLPRLLIVLHCHAMARYFGVSSGAALLVAGIPLGVEWAIGPWVGQALSGFLPEMPDVPAGDK